MNLGYFKGVKGAGLMFKERAEKESLRRKLKQRGQKVRDRKNREKNITEARRNEFQEENV